MVERICPRCQAGNPLDHRFCGQCGTSLERTERFLPGPESTSLMITGALPTRLRQIGRAMLVSLVTLAAEAGMVWLWHRIEAIRRTPPLLAKEHIRVGADQQCGRASAASTDSGALPIRPSAGSGHYEVIVCGQRVVESWEQGQLVRQTVDRQIWRWEKR